MPTDNSSTNEEVKRRSERFKQRYKDLQYAKNISEYGIDSMVASVDRLGDGFSPFEIITLKKGYPISL